MADDRDETQAVAVCEPQPVDVPEPVATSTVGIDAAAGAVSEFAAVEASRWSLEGIHYRPGLHDLPGFVEATDGRMILRVPVVKVPDFPNGPTLQPEPGDSVIPRSTLDAAVKSIPKGRALKNLPYAVQDTLSCALLSRNNGTVSLTTSDLETVDVKTAKVPEKGYPDTDLCFPSAEPTFTATLSASRLEALACYACRYGRDDAETGRVIVLEFRQSVATVSEDDDTPAGLQLENDQRVTVRIPLSHGREATGLLMPIK